jgi:hypothetical protein
MAISGGIDGGNEDELIFLVPILCLVHIGD